MLESLSNTPLSATEKSLNSEEVFVFPASFAQQRLWFLDQLVPGNPFYNVSAAVRLSGQLNESALEQTFNEIVRRHEALRTTFVMVEGQLSQVIAPSLSLSLPVVSLQELPTAQQQIIAQQMASQEAQRPFALSAGPLLRVKLLRLEEADHILLLNLHHIIADGWSMGVLIRELGAIYTAFSDRLPSPLPELPIQYADFAHWQREWLQGEVLAAQLTYWKQQLEGISVLNLPTDKPRPKLQSYRGATQLFELPQSLTKALLALSQQSGVTLFMLLLAAFQTLLYRYTGQEDISVGTPIANRNRSELEGLIGFFVNSLVMRTNLSGNPTFRELLGRVREVAMSAYDHQDLPFEKLVEELHPERDLSRNPLFSAVFALQNAPLEALLPGLTLSSLNFDTNTTRFDLEFHLYQYLENLRCTVVYSTELFDSATITRMLRHFQTLLAGIVDNPNQRVASLPLLTTDESHQLLVWNTKANYAQDTCIHRLFEATVTRSPDAIAVVFESQLTYRELNQRANQLAHYLQKLGVGPEVLVGIFLERSLEMIVAVLGILKAGGAYVPLDTSYPRDRLNLMLADAQVSILLTQLSLEQIGQKLHVICLDQEWEVISQQSDKNPNSDVKADNLAYVIYTSGSTGKPKGVLVQHRGLSNLAEAQMQTFNLKPENRVLQFASLSFDASIFEIVMALRVGATLFLAPKEFLPKALLQLLRDKEITNVTLPPAVLTVLPSEDLPRLHTVISAGEACSGDILRWADGRQLFNAYGPTEATIWATVAQLNDDSSTKPLIGHPIANTQIYLLNAALQPVPIGVAGELYIGGVGIARGYLNRPDITAQAFIPNPFSNNPGTRLYKTGDLARWRSNGNIEFLGRQDSQVKIRGFRIELGEISTVLTQHPAIQEAVVIVRENIPGDQRLVAYIVPQEQAITPDDLRCFMRSKLPDYLVPSAFVILETLPLTQNGKVNYHALPAPDMNSVLESYYVAPRTPTEETLAKIWAEVLNLERVGIDDNFFELGGNSLLSISLMEQIHEQFGQQIPLSTLFLAPTIAGLAKSLHLGADSLAWSPLVSIQPAGNKPPFFCVHPVLGVVFPYYELAYYLGHDQPFYGLQPLGLDKDQTPLTQIEDMATHYIEALRGVQPQGPYFLGGWSFGGLVAFEMAQQLQMAGHQVAILALIDTIAPVSSQPSVSDFNFFSTAVRSIWPYILDYFYLMTTGDRQQSKDVLGDSFKLNNILRWFGRSWRSILRQAAIAHIVPQSEMLMLNEPTIRSMLRLLEANSQAVRNYVPQPYPNQITVFRTNEPASIAHQDPTLGWNQLALGEVKIQSIPGNHLSALRKPHVQVLAEQLKAYIDKALIR